MVRSPSAEVRDCETAGKALGLESMGPAYFSGPAQDDNTCIASRSPPHPASHRHRRTQRARTAAPPPPQSHDSILRGVGCQPVTGPSTSCWRGRRRAGRRGHLAGMSEAEQEQRFVAKFVPLSNVSERSYKILYEAISSSSVGTAPPPLEPACT